VHTLPTRETPAPVHASSLDPEIQERSRDIAGHTALDHLPPFTVDYEVGPAWLSNGYDVRLAFRDGQLTLRARNTPGFVWMSPEEPVITEPPLRILPPQEAVRIVKLLRKVQIAPDAGPSLLMAEDAASQDLEIHFGDLDVSLRWCHEFSTGWKGLEPLLALLDRYSTAYGHVPTFASHP